MPGLSATASASILVPESSAALSRLFTPMSLSVLMPGLSAAVPELFVAMPRSTTAVPGSSVAVPGSSTSAFASVSLPRLSAPVPPSAPVLPRLSPLSFPALSLLKTTTPDLAAERRKLDDIIGEWSGKSKRASSEELYSGKIKKGSFGRGFLAKSNLISSFLPV